MVFNHPSRETSRSEDIDTVTLTICSVSTLECREYQSSVHLTLMCLNGGGVGWGMKPVVSCV